ncbi:MAG: 50S ribosomal protein L29 [Oscillospiraceae bacterium]|jgi:large subunit ribosomal protein L29|nr:50S ribosomal protein L29 [Oscillospiraceae bacterium]
MKVSDVRALSTDELGAKLNELKKDLFMLRMQLATNQLSNPMKIHEVKHAIARVKTVQRERELAR